MQWLSLLGMGFVTALQWVILPTFVALVLFSLVYRAFTKRWIQLWKPALVLLLVALIGTLAFTEHWHDLLYAHPVG